MSYYTSSARKETIQWTSTSDTASPPGIGEENYKAVDRCVGPTDLFSTALALPWAIVDGAWAEQKPELLGTLREHGTSLLVDTHGWRFRHEAASAACVSDRRRYPHRGPGRGEGPGGRIPCHTWAFEWSG